MVNSRRVRRSAVVLLGACVLLLPGCFTITLWEHAPCVEVKEVAGAEVDASHVLAVDVRYTNGRIERYDYALTGKASSPVRVDRADPPLPSDKFVVVPTPPGGSNLEGDRFAAGSVLEITYARFGGLEVRQVLPEGGVDRQFVPDGGPDWGVPSNYGRALLTVPAVVLDVVTSPIQLGVFCWVLIAHPRM
jgi:hypothetical protein